MDEIREATVYISLGGTALGMTSRIPQIVRVWQRRSGDDLSARALALNITANLCFLTYSVAHAQWPVAVNNLAVVALDGALLVLRNRFRGMKKSSSGTDLAMMGGEEGGY